MPAKRVVVVGGGLVGLATALKLGERDPDLVITLLEKEHALGRHQSGHNSGVLHAGLYYRPGSAKARLAVAGIREMTAFCQTHKIPHEICGKLVVATDESQLPRLESLLERGIRNGLRGLMRLGPEAMREIEPHVGGIAALHVPEEGIVDYPRVAETMGALLTDRGARVVTGAKVLAIRSSRAEWTLETEGGSVAADFLVTCAGLHADRLCAMAGHDSEIRIVPFRGEYFTLRAGREHLVRNLVYPVPDPAFPFLGVHFTRMIRGGVEAGPNAVLALAREGYSWRHISVRDTFDALTFPGLWRFMRRFPGATVSEVRRSLSRAQFAASLRALVPEVEVSDLVAGGAGVRAQAMNRDGTLVEDFAFAEHPGALHVLNAPSPAATGSLAIGGEIATRVEARL